MPADNRKPYDRQPLEPIHWYRRFRRWLGMPNKRSFRAVYHAESGKLGSVPQSWREVFRRWKWQERANAFDAEFWDTLRIEKRKVRNEPTPSEIEELLALIEEPGIEIASPDDDWSELLAQIDDMEIEE